MGRTIALQLDEVRHDLRTMRRKRWLWKALDRDPGPRLDWEGGRRDKKTLKKMVDRLTQWDVQLYCTDKWATYTSVIPTDKLGTGCEFWASLEPFEAKGENRESCDLAIRHRWATHPRAQAHV